MNNSIDLKTLWKQQVVSEPNMQELTQKLNKFKRDNILKLLLANSLLLGTTVAIGLIFYYNQPSLITTKIGIVLVILAMLIYLFTYNKLLPAFNKVNDQQNNAGYLQSLISIKNKQQVMQSTMLSLYFIMISVGICLCMYEYTRHMTLLWAVFAYGTTALWIAFNWFYTRPKSIKKQLASVNELIAKFKAMNEQLNEKTV